MNIYYSLFHRNLHYCSILWGNTYFSNIKCITILQNRYLRSIYYLNNRTNIDHIYIHKRILKFNDIIDCNTCIKLGTIIIYIHKLLSYLIKKIQYIL